MERVYVTKVWTNEAEFSSLEEAKKYVRTILEIYQNSGINAALISWSITTKLK